MQHYQARNIIHRDLKPENIMFGTDGKVRICDFGISTKIKEEKMFKHGEVGTLAYMAPEVLNHNYNKAADIWSLGVVLTEMVTGELPFDPRIDGEGYCRKNIKCGKR